MLSSNKELICFNGKYNSSYRTKALVNNLKSSSDTEVLLNALAKKLCNF